MIIFGIEDADISATLCRGRILWILNPGVIVVSAPRPRARLVAKSPCAKGRFLGFGLCRWRGRFAAFPANE